MKYILELRQELIVSGYRAESFYQSKSLLDKIEVLLEAPTLGEIKKTVLDIFKINIDHYGTRQIEILGAGEGNMNWILIWLLPQEYKTYNRDRNINILLK